MSGEEGSLGPRTLCTGGKCLRGFVVLKKREGWRKASQKENAIRRIVVEVGQEQSGEDWNTKGSGARERREV